eukprot:1951369-Lingulodinium_polyedra.AAC.1
MQTPKTGVRMACATRAICKPLWRRIVDLNTFWCSVSQALRENAVESTTRRRSGLRVARVAHTMRTRRVVDSTAFVCSVFLALHEHAFKSIIRRRSGLRIVRVARTMRTPKLGV